MERRGGPVKFTTSVKCLCQRETELNGGHERESRIGQKVFDRGLVGEWEFVAQPRCHPRERAGVVRIAAERFPERCHRLVELTKLLTECAGSHGMWRGWA